VAAYFGDASGNLGYDSTDATLVRRIIGQLHSGLAAYQLVDPQLIVDITLNGLIQSNDTSNIRRAILQADVPNIPELPEGLSEPAARGADPRIYIPLDLAASPGQTVTVPVMIDVTDPAGATIGGFDLLLEYDAERFVVSQAMLGSLLQGTDLVGAMTQLAPGKLLFSADSLLGTPRFPTGTVGTLVTLTVAVAADAAPGPATWNLLASSGRSRTAVFDAGLKELVLNPPPTNDARDPGDGRLLVDDGWTPWQNAANPHDVNGDGLASALDVLVLINYLNAQADGHWPPVLEALYRDVNGDSACTPQDVLAAVNYLNFGWAPAEEGERPAIQIGSERAVTASGRPAVTNPADSLFRDLAGERSPLEGVLDDLAADIASVWRCGGCLNGP
jgi:hypothetical protein